MEKARIKTEPLRRGGVLVRFDEFDEPHDEHEEREDERDRCDLERHQESYCLPAHVSRRAR
jgi:hypothetical protein